LTDHRTVLRDSRSLLRLFAVGVAWGTPLILVGLTNVGPGPWAAHPQLAEWLEPLLLLSVLLVPALATGGIVVVSRLSRHPPRPNTASVLVFATVVGLPLLLGMLQDPFSPVVLVLLLFEAGLSSPNESRMTKCMALIVQFPAILAVVETALALVVGVVVSVVTLWRRRVWLAPAWLAAWLLTAALIWVGERPVANPPGDLHGVVMWALGLGLLATSLLATIIVAALGARRDRLSRQVLTGKA
jgi:hypothetical protein